MNPITNIKNLNKLNQRELELGLTNKKSWHEQYKDSAWLYVGGLPYDLTEGDVICIFSQYGEVVNINLVRDQKTGKSKGFCFICFEDQRSTILTVDNLNGIKVLGRMIKVDHVEEYRLPKEHGDEDDVTRKIRAEGCAPKVRTSSEEEEEEELVLPVKQKVKKEKKKKDKKKKKMKLTETEEGSDEDCKAPMKVKAEKVDAGYDKALLDSRENSKNEKNFHGSRKQREPNREYQSYGKDSRDDRYRHENQGEFGNNRERDRQDSRGENRERDGQDNRGENRERDRQDSRGENRERDGQDNRGENRERDRQDNRGENRERDRQDNRGENRERDRQDNRGERQWNSQQDRSGSDSRSGRNYSADWDSHRNERDGRYTQRNDSLDVSQERDRKRDHSRERHSSTSAEKPREREHVSEHSRDRHRSRSRDRISGDRSYSEHNSYRRDNRR